MVLHPIWDAVFYFTQPHLAAEIPNEHYQSTICVTTGFHLLCAREQRANGPPCFVSVSNGWNLRVSQFHFIFSPLWNTSKQRAWPSDSFLWWLLMQDLMHVDKSIFAKSVFLWRSYVWDQSSPFAESNCSIAWSQEYLLESFCLVAVGWSFIV